MAEIALDHEPVIRELQYGGWLATTSANTKIRIGVIGATMAEARALFVASLQRWREMSEAEKAEERSA